MSESEPIEKHPRVEERAPPTQLDLVLDVPRDDSIELKIHMYDMMRCMVHEGFKNISNIFKRRLMIIHDLMRKLPSSLDMAEDEDVYHDFTVSMGCAFHATLCIVNDSKIEAKLLYYDDYEKITLRYEKWEVRFVRRKL